MLTIRDEQMKAFAAVRRKTFEEKLTAHLLKEFKEEVTATLGCTDEPAVREFVLHGIDSALAHGIEDEDDVTSLVEIKAELGSEFETKPGYEWAAKLLDNRKLTSHAKIELLIDGLSGDNT